MSLVNKFLEAPEDHGFAGCVPSGIYPVVIKRAVGKASSKKTSVQVNLGMQILDGPFKDQYVSVTHYLPNIFDPEVYEKEKYVQGARGLLGVLGVTEEFAARATEAEKNLGAVEDSVDAAVAAFAVEELWIDKKLIANVGFETAVGQYTKYERQVVAGTADAGADPGGFRDRNTLNGWHDWEDKSHGYANWQKRELPKQKLQSSTAAKTTKQQSNDPIVI